jgi:hypothetical protein
MAISQSQKNNILWVGIFLICVLFIGGISWFIDDYLTHKMTEMCHNLSMEYYYKDSSSFYCLSTNGSIIIKEIRYK